MSTSSRHLSVALAMLVGCASFGTHAQGWQAGTRTPVQPQQETQSTSNRPVTSVGPATGYGPGYGSASGTTPAVTSSTTTTLPAVGSGVQSVGPVAPATSTANQWRGGVRLSTQPNTTTQPGRGVNNGGYGGYGSYNNYGNVYDDATTPYRGDPALRYSDPYRYSNPYGPPVRNDCVDVNGASIPCNR